MLNEIKTTSEKLLDAGINAADRVGILSESDANYVILILALWNIRAIAVPLSTRYTPAQLKQSVEISDVKKLFISKSFDAARKMGFTQSAFNIENFTDLNTDQIGQLTFDNFNFDLNTNASIIFTSASSSKPKAVLHTIANHYYSALGSNENIPFTNGDAWLMSLPMYHISGMSLIMRSLINKAAIIFPKPNEPISLAIQNPALTHISLVPAQLSTLLESAESISRLQQFKAILIGGSAVSANLIKRSLENALPIFTSYGSAEMGSQITTTAPGELYTNAETSGKLLSYRQLKIAADGEILVKGKTLFKGYITKGSIESSIDKDGYFHTNDIGELDNEGNLIVSGRKDLMFISGGENIHPEQIEREIERIENVEMAIVIPAYDKKFGKVPAAFIKMQKGHCLSSQVIQAQLQKTIESFKIPKNIYPWPSELQNTMKPDRKFFINLLQNGTSGR